MNKMTTTLIATVLVSTIGAGAFVTSATAGDRNRDAGPRGGKAAIEKICSGSGVERLDRMLTHASQRADLTELQTQSFETFRDAAVTAQSGVTEVCDELALGEDANLIDRLNFRQAIMSAELEALAGTMPALEEFYNGLTQEQQALLQPGGSRHSNQERRDTQMRHNQHDTRAHS